LQEFLVIALRSLYPDQRDPSDPRVFSFNDRSQVFTCGNLLQPKTGHKYLTIMSE